MIRTRNSLAVLFALTSACTTTYTWHHQSLEQAPRGAPQPAPYPTTEQRRWAHLFAFGLIGRSFVDARDVCPGPAANQLRTGITVPTVLVSIATLGVYTPLDHRFSCFILPPDLSAPPRVVLEETPPLEPFDEPIEREYRRPPAEEIEPKPEPLEPEPLETEPTEIEPEPTERTETEPEPTEPEPTEPEPTEPEPTEPEPTEPGASRAPSLPRPATPEDP